MSDTTKEVFTTREGTKIDIDPNLLIDIIEEVNTMVSSHYAIVKSVRTIIEKGLKSGLQHDQAAAVAMELQRRAGKKANEMESKENEAAKMPEMIEVKEDEKEEEEKKDEE